MAAPPVAVRGLQAQSLGANYATLSETVPELLPDWKKFGSDIVSGEMQLDHARSEAVTDMRQALRAGLAGLARARMFGGRTRCGLACVACGIVRLV